MAFSKKRPPDNRPNDKIKAQYKMYINKSEKHHMVLQYPNRDRSQPYSEATGQKPIELRIKPKCGLVEIDVPLNLHTNFDKAKGIEYGEAMRKSKVLQGGGSYGMAGGLGIASQVRSSKNEARASAAEPSQEALLENFSDSNNKGHVMNKITLSGQINPYKEGDPQYFLGVFRRDELHLTRCDAIVQLRPKLDHLDALTDQDKASTKVQRETENPTPESEARAVNLAVKSSDGEELGKSDVAKILREMQEEPWQRLEFIDSEDPRSYEMYKNDLFLPYTEKARRLYSPLTNQQYLDAISAPRKDPTRPPKKMMSRPTSFSDSSDLESSDEVSNDGDKEQDEEEGIGRVEAGDGRDNAREDEDGDVDDRADNIIETDGAIAGA